MTHFQDSGEAVAQILTGEVAVVTGAAQGNGAAIALGLALAGALVVVADLDESKAADTAQRIKDQGGDARSFRVDVTDPGDCARLATEVADQVGDISVLVNNAGVLVKAAILADDVREAWTRNMSVNLEGPFNMVHAFLPALIRRTGTIINIASVQAFAAPPPSSSYNASKGALLQLTRSLATELAPQGIRVNGIAPGAMETAMTEGLRGEPERLARFLQRVPMGRLGKPEELVAPVVFLASRSASFVTGVMLPVDGGFLAL